MARNISFSLTTDQIRNRTKTVTRRAGWKFLKPGDILNACVKCQGLKKGEKVDKICQIRILDVKREQLWDITDDDLIKEGFPEMSRDDFMIMFWTTHFKGNIVWGDQLITRIEFEYI